MASLGFQVVQISSTINLLTSSEKGPLGKQFRVNRDNVHLLTDG